MTLIILELLMCAVWPPMNANSLRPVALFRGSNHRFQLNQFVILNSRKEAVALFSRGFHAQNYSLAPEIDFRRYSAICIFVKRGPLLRTLEFVRFDQSNNTLAVYYSEERITQIFLGINDKAAEAPYLLLVVPKWKGDVVFYANRQSLTGQSRWILQSYIPRKQWP
jgi:hypothetical protein